MITENIFTPDEVERAKEDYGDFVKVVVDVETRRVGAGGEWHADAEKIMLDTGSKQENLWGGGVNLVRRTITYTALINMRPRYSKSQDVLDEKIREIMKTEINRVFGGGYE